MGMTVERHKRWRKSFPYYKIQYYEPNTLAWREIQGKAYPTLNKAHIAGKQLGKRYRIVEIQRKGRRFL